MLSKMKPYNKTFVITLLLSMLLIISPVFANNQGFETIDCNTKALKDSFSTSENVCIKETRVSPGNDCGDGGDLISVYTLPYKTNYDTPDGSFFYTYGRSLTNWPYYKVFQTTINPDRTIFANLGTYSAGSYDIAQGANGAYTGPCLDELGSPLVSAGFDIIAQAQQQPGTEGFPCTADASCKTGLYCANIQPNGIGTCAPKAISCTEDWSCGDWVCFNSKISRACNDLNTCGTTTNKPITEYPGTCSQNGARSKDDPASLLSQPLTIEQQKQVEQTLQDSFQDRIANLNIGLDPQLNNLLILSTIAFIVWVIARRKK